MMEKKAVQMQGSNAVILIYYTASSNPSVH